VNAVPVIVTFVPTTPLVGEKLVMVGGGITVKELALVPVPPAVVTLMVPVVAPPGTVAVICVAELTVNVAAVPLNFTAVAPVKAVPVIVTFVPTAPPVGEKLVMVGGGMTVKELALVPVPPAVVTLIVPVVAPAGTVAVICVSEFTVNEAVVPLNFTAVAPVNAVPVIVTLVPIAPLVGEKLITEGVGMTVKELVLVPVPLAVVTLIVPVVAPLGTVAVICVSEFTVKVAAVPLNFTAVAPVNAVPVSVTLAPTPPLVGEKLMIVGAGLPPVPLLRGLTVPAVKSAALSSVSVAPPFARRSEVVAEGAGAGPEPSYALAVVP
jgi:hypothetical protein